MDLTKEQLKKRKQMILNLKKEIKTLESTLKNPKLAKAKNQAIKNLKLLETTGKFLAPYVLVAGLTVTSFVKMESTPFVRDQYHENLNIRQEYDNFGNYTSKEQYTPFKSSDSILIYTSKWTLEDGIYSRIVASYDISSLNVEALIDAVTKNDFSIKEILGEPKTRRVENRTSLSDENNSESLKAIIYSVDEDKFILKEQSADENVKETVLWLLFTLFFEYLVKLFDGRTPIGKKIKMVVSKYQGEDLVLTYKKLQLKRENYNRLVGKNFEK